MKLVLIPPGEFEMGSPKELIEEELRLHGDNVYYRWCVPGEGPVHWVRITKPFWLGVTEVTQEDYEHLMGSDPSFFQGDPKRPVDQVSWDNAMEFCRRLSGLPLEKAAKWRYDLPTEAQWEYACRAGSSAAFGCAEDVKSLGKYAWYNENSRGYTHRVGQKRPNAWGLYDIQGNVWQWCRDWYDRDYYGKSPTDDPLGPPAGLCHVTRGGDWAADPSYCRAAWRNPNAQPDLHQGFRVILVPVEKSVGSKIAPASDSPVVREQSSAPIAPANVPGKPLMAEAAKKQKGD